LIRAIQFVECFQDEHEAEQAYEFMQEQDGLLAVRLLEPSMKNPLWQLQAIFKDETEINNNWLPDGCRKVVLIENIINQFRRTGICFI